MKLLYPVSVLLLLALDVAAGDVHGRALVTRRLSKKALSPIVYNLRGATAPAAAREPEPVNEFDRMVVILEPGKDAGKDQATLPSKPPVTEVLNQQGARFDPDL